MTRYIDADKVMEEINRIGGHNLCEWETLGVKALIDRQPTADVVPKSEVDKWFRECEELQGRLIEVKKEVVREIFGEIEKSIVDLEYQAKTPRKTVKVEELKAQCDWILHEVIPKSLAELKKKHIGDKQRKEDEKNEV